MENGQCDRCGRDVFWVAGIKRPLDPVPQPYVAGAPGWAFSYSRGWVQSNNQPRPPQEHLVEHFWICSERMAVRDVEGVSDDEARATPPRSPLHVVEFALPDLQPGMGL